MTEVTYQLVKLDDLSIAPTNARFGRDVPTEDLQTSIAGAGRLVTPLSCYPRLQDGSGGWLVWDGGRRLLALQALAKAKKLPPALKAGVPCLCYPDDRHAATIQRDSLATFVREGMTPADEFEAIQRLVAGGLSLTETAAALNLRTARVQQLQRLIGLAPEVLSAFTASKIPLDVAEAFSLTESHDRQREVLKAFNPKKDNAWGVRSQMRKGAIERGNRWTQFIGRDAYVAAGGTFLNDLFSNNQQEDWADPELVTRLAKEKLEALVKKTEAEGWEWVVVDDQRHYGWDSGFNRIPGKKATFTLEEKATAGASIYIAHNGQPEIERGLVKKAKGKAVDANGEPVKKIDQALHGFGHGGHQRLTEVATAATQVAIGNDTGAAYDGLLSALAWEAFRADGRAIRDIQADHRTTYEANAMSLSASARGVGFMRLSDVAGVDHMVARAKSWSARLPVEGVPFCDYVASLTVEEKADLLALSFAWSLNAVEGRFVYLAKARRWAHLGWLGRRARLDIAAAWTPDEEFLKKGSKEALLIGNTAMGGADGMGGAKKGELVAYVAKQAAQKRWVPKLLSDLFAAPPSEKPKAVKPKAESKRMFKDQLAADMAAVAAESVQDGQEPAETSPVVAGSEQPQE